MIIYVESKRPLLNELNDYVVLEVAVKWKDLGAQLLRPDKQKELDIIENDHPRDSKECCKCVLKNWLDTTIDASWDQLITALKSPSVGLNSFAFELNERIKKRKREICYRIVLNCYIVM